MTSRVKVSRKGMTTCPACLAHIRVASPINVTVCPFCSTSLADSTARTELGGVGRVMQAGRTGVLAASLLGMTGIVGCDSTSNNAPKDAAGADVVMDIGDQPVYGLPADSFAPDIVEDTGPQPQPAYGISADVTEDATEPGDATNDTASDATEDMAVQPVYGAPADAE